MVSLIFQRKNCNLNWELKWIEGQGSLSSDYIYYFFPYVFIYAYSPNIHNLKNIVLLNFNYEEVCNTDVLSILVCNTVGHLL